MTSNRFDLADMRSAVGRLTSRVTTRVTRPAAATAFALAVAFGAASAQADVAELVPSDALVVVKINNLQQTNDELSALLTEGGIDQLAGDPAAANPLQAFKDEFKRESERQGGNGELNGIDWNGSPVVYLTKPVQMDDMGGDMDDMDDDMDDMDVSFQDGMGDMQDMEDGQDMDDMDDMEFDGGMQADVPGIVVLVPITDFQGFINSFGGGVQEGNVFMVDMDGEDVYFADMGDYAAMSPFKQLVTGEKPAKSFMADGPAGDRLNEMDVTVFANFAEIGPMLQKAVEDEGAKEAMMQEMGNAFQDDQIPESIRKLQPAIETLAGQGFAAFESFLRDADAATISVDFDPEAGVAGNVTAQFKDGSYLADTLGSMKASDGNLLAGLPEGNYLMFGGQANDTEVMGKLVTDFFGPVRDALAEIDGGEMMLDYLDLLETEATAVQGTTFGMFAPAGQMGAPLIQTVGITTGDAEQLMEATKKGAQMLPKFMSSMAPQGAGAPPVEVTVEDGARTVNGVSFTKVSTGMAQGDPMTAMITNMIFGPEGQAQYLGVSDGKLIAVQGMNDTQIASVIDAAKAGESPMSEVDNVMRVSKMLPENRTGEFYLNVDEFGRTVLGLARQFGQAVPIDLPDDVPPMGFAVGPAEDAFQVGVFIHKDLVSTMIVAAEQAQQMQNGGGNMGGGL